MKRKLVTAMLLMLFINHCVNGAGRQKGLTTSTSEQEIRAALCDIESGDFATAEKKLEKVLQSDPRNIYAQRLLLGTITRLVKPGDNSSENIARARKAIEASQRALKNPEFTLKEKAGIDRYILALYGVISLEERNSELLRRVSDPNRTSEERSEIYTILASESWSCAFDITESPDNKVTKIQNDKAVVWYKMPMDPMEYERARMCVKRGMEEVENAINLAPKNDSAWSYRTNLLIESQKLAEMDNNSEDGDSIQKQIDDAQMRVRRGIALRERELEVQSKKEAEEHANKLASRKKLANKQPDDQELLTKELAEFKTENPLDAAVEEFSFSYEYVSLVVPIPIAPDPIAPESGGATIESEPISQATQKGCFREVDGLAQVLEKRDWKIFSPAGEDFTVELPDSLCSSGGGYIAASDGVMYSISVMDRPSVTVDPTVVDGVLNTLARSFVGFRSRAWVRGANSFEVKMLKKVYLNDHSGKVYAYALISCSKRKDGVLIVYAGKSHYYTVDISGASESDQRVQRFLNSVKLK